MLKKQTDDMMTELTSDTGLDKYIKDNEDYFIDGSIAQYLNDIIEQKGITKSKVFARAEISDIYGYQLLSGVRKPSRDKLIQLCIGMELPLNEVQAALKFAGFASLYPKSKRDSVMIAGITENKSVFEINQLLFDHGEETLN